MFNSSANVILELRSAVSPVVIGQTTIPIMIKITPIGSSNFVAISLTATAGAEAYAAPSCGWPWKNANATAAQQRAVMPSKTIAPKNTGLESFSVFMHLATIGDCDA